jgi:hypothetical protein
MKMTNSEKRNSKRDRKIRKRYLRVFYRDVQRSLQRDCPKVKNGDLFGSLEVVLDNPRLLFRTTDKEKLYIAELIGKFIKIKNPELCVNYKVSPAITHWIDLCDDLIRVETVSLTLYLNSI